MYIHLHIYIYIYVYVYHNLFVYIMVYIYIYIHIHLFVCSVVCDMYVSSVRRAKHRSQSLCRTSRPSLLCASRIPPEPQSGALRVRAWGSGFRSLGFRVRAWGSGFRSLGFGARGSWVEGFRGFRVRDPPRPKPLSLGPLKPEKMINYP